jgi:HEAT repeat protein
VRNAAAEALGLIGDKRAIDALGKLLLRNKSSLAAARALGRFRDPQAIEPLKQVLWLPDIEYNVVPAAAESLGQIRHPDAIAALVQASKLTGYDGVCVRIVLGRITGNSFEQSPEVIDAWWQANREHYYREVPAAK